MLTRTALRRAALAALLGVFLMVGLLPQAGAIVNPFIVTRTADDTLPGSLRGEILLAAASPGATIIFQIPTTDPGYNSTTKTWTISTNRTELDIATSLSINGPDPATGSVIVDGGGASPIQTGSRVFNISAGTVSISNLTIQNGYTNGAFGAGILNATNLTLTNCIVTKNTTSLGGAGIYNSGANAALNLNSCSVSNNTGTAGGGIALYNDHGQITLTNSQVDGNVTGGYGPGGIYSNGTATLTDCEIANNNSAATFSSGGFTNSGTWTMTNCRITANIGEGSGGGFANGGQLTMTGCTISGNSTNREPYGNGGGFSNGGTLQATNCLINGNQTSGNGGGIDNIGTLNLVNCMISGNYTGPFSPQGGGGISNEGTLVATNCIVESNATGVRGGGIDNSSTLTLTNCIVAGNKSIYDGGGIYSTNTLTAINCTVTDNSDDFGTGEGINAAGTVTLLNDIVYGNKNSNGSPDSDLVISAPGSKVSVTYSDIGGGFAGTGNINADPLFVHTPDDLHLSPGSPAINAGTTGPNVPLTDIEGYTRDSKPDVGAYEFHSGFSAQGGFFLNATQGQSTGTQTVAKFFNTTSGLTYTATIAWGDGTTSAGTVTPDPAVPGGYLVTGSHVYTGYETFTITVSIADTGHTVRATVFSTATVVPAQIAADVTAQVSVVRAGLVYNRGTQRYYQTVTIKNITAAPITGPLFLALDSLTTGATLVSVTGTTKYTVPAGSPYQSVTAGSLAPGASVSVLLQFTYSGITRLGYTPRVLAGPGAL